MTTPSPEHLEHVARAMYNACPNKTPGWLDWDQMHYGYKLPWIAVATAAILASQEWERNNATQQQDTQNK